MFNMKLSVMNDPPHTMSAENHAIYSHDNPLPLTEKALKELASLRNFLSYPYKLIDQVPYLIYAIDHFENYLSVLENPYPVYFAMHCGEHDKKFLLIDNPSAFEQETINYVYKDFIRDNLSDIFLNNSKGRLGAFAGNIGNCFASMIDKVSVDRHLINDHNPDLIYNMLEIYRNIRTEKQIELNYIFFYMYQKMQERILTKEERLEIYASLLMNCSDYNELSYKKMSASFLKQSFQTITDFPDYNLTFEEPDISGEYIDFLVLLNSNISSLIELYYCYYLANYIFFSLKKVEKKYNNEFEYTEGELNYRTKKRDIPIIKTNNRNLVNELRRINAFYFFMTNKTLYKVQLMNNAYSLKETSEHLAINSFKNILSSKNSLIDIIGQDEYQRIINIVEKQNLQYTVEANSENIISARL